MPTQMSPLTDRLVKEIAIMTTCVEAVMLNQDLDASLVDGLCFQWERLKGLLLNEKQSEDKSTTVELD